MAAQGAQVSLVKFACLSGFEDSFETFGIIQIKMPAKYTLKE